MRLKIREYREQAKLTQKQFAKAIKKAVGTIQSWEAGDSYPNAEALCFMCEFFHTDPNTLLGWYDEHPEDRPSASVSREESTLLDNYRSCSPERRASVSGYVRDQCELSKGKEGQGSSFEEAV